MQWHAIGYFKDYPYKTIHCAYEEVAQLLDNIFALALNTKNHKMYTSYYNLKVVSNSVHTWSKYSNTIWLCLHIKMVFTLTIYKLQTSHNCNNNNILYLKKQHT